MLIHSITKSNTVVRFQDLIAPIYYNIYRDIKAHNYTHYWFKGGRGSTKSSFISMLIIISLMKKENKGKHAAVFRRVGDTLRDSVYAQLQWAINTLGVEKYWEAKINPLQLTYKDNGNKIVFRGVDDPAKIKSMKANTGYFAYIWFEELAEFRCLDDVNSILQSVMRGGKDFWCMYSYNPPESAHSWVNAESVIQRKDRIVHHSTYLSVPQEWLGEAFIIEAEHLKNTHPKKYEWQYLGNPTGTGGEIFTNVHALDITDDMIAEFDNVKAGLDWGWSIDPLAYVEFHYDKRKRAIYIYDEYYGLKISNKKIAKYIKTRDLPCTVKADSAEGKSISDLRNYGIKIAPCMKGRGSRTRTMRLLTDDLDYIYIDPKRCPNTYREFIGYELERDRNGNFKSEYPDKNDHTIDAVRYALDSDGGIKSARSNIY